MLGICHQMILKLVDAYDVVCDRTTSNKFWKLFQGIYDLFWQKIGPKVVISTLFQLRTIQPATWLPSGLSGGGLRYVNGGGWWHSGKMSAAPVRVKGMHPFPLRLPRTLALESHPHPGPASARSTGAQRQPEIHILGRVMSPSSHACQLWSLCHGGCWWEY